MRPLPNPWEPPFYGTLFLYGSRIFSYEIFMVGDTVGSGWTNKTDPSTGPNGLNFALKHRFSPGPLPMRYSPGHVQYWKNTDPTSTPALGAGPSKFPPMPLAPIFFPNSSKWGETDGSSSYSLLPVHPNVSVPFLAILLPFHMRSPPTNDFSYRSSGLES